MLVHRLKIRSLPRISGIIQGAIRPSPFGILVDRATCKLVFREPSLSLLYSQFPQNGERLLA